VPASPAVAASHAADGALTAPSLPIEPGLIAARANLAAMIGAPSNSSVVAASHAADGAASAANAPNVQRGGCATNVQIPEESVYVGRMTDEPSEINASIWSDRDLGIDAQSDAKALIESRPLGNGNKVTVRTGSVVFAPQTDTIVETPFGDVSIDAGSMVLIMSDANAVGVYNIDDSHRGAVTINHDGSKLALTPGKHAVLTRQEVKNFEMINPAEAFGYRNVKDTTFGAGVKAFIGEFSVHSTISAVPQLRQLITSKQAEAHRLAEHVLKTIAIVLQMKGGDGEYQQVRHPHIAAYAP